MSRDMAFTSPSPALGTDRTGIHRHEGNALSAVLTGQRLGEILSSRVGGARRDLPSKTA